MASLQLRAGSGATAPSIQPPPSTPSFVVRPAAPAVERPRRTHLRSEAAYEELLPELLAVPEAQLLPVSADVMSAITTVADALPGLSELCSEVEPASAQRSREEPELHMDQLERLEQYTLALGHAHLLYCGSFSPALDVTLLAAELSKVRDAMLAHAEALAADGLLDGQRLQRVALRSSLHSAHRALAGDVIALCAAFKDHWTQLEDKTPYTLEEQHRLVLLALDLMAALGAPEPATGSAGESAAIRQRAFTLFACAYEGVRASVKSLRSGAGDADVFAPPLPGERAPRPRLTVPQRPVSAAAAPPPPEHAESRAPSHPAATRD